MEADWPGVMLMGGKNPRLLSFSRIYLGPLGIGGAIE